MMYDHNFRVPLLFFLPPSSTTSSSLKHRCNPPPLPPQRPPTPRTPVMLPLWLQCLPLSERFIAIITEAKHGQHSTRSSPYLLLWVVIFVVSSSLANHLLLATPTTATFYVDCCLLVAATSGPRCSGVLALSRCRHRPCFARIVVVRRSLSSH